MNWRRYQLVDFSHPVMFSSLTILSSSKSTLDGKLVEGVFNNFPYYLILASFAGLILTLYVTHRRSEKLTNCLFLVMRTLFRQDGILDLFQKGRAKRLSEVLAVFTTLSCDQCLRLGPLPRIVVWSRLRWSMHSSI